MLAWYNLTRPQLAERFRAAGLAPVHAQRMWRYLYRDLVASPAEMSDLPAAVRAFIAQCPTGSEFELADQIRSDEGRTQKYLLRLPDEAQIETVEMHYRDRVTACLSSQVGCALGCVFCATGQLGFSRDLSAGEIVAQAVYVAQSARPSNERLRNIVLMGMGEPLLNYEAVMTALEILHDSGGLAIGAKQITLSTVGVIPAIVRLADERRPYSLAVSLHAATQAERLALVPAARPWPLDELMAACRYYIQKLDRKIFFEWTLIAGGNDSADQTRTLGELLQGMRAHVNLIPLNSTTGFSGQAASAPSAARFQAILAEYSVPSTIRQRRGVDIAAGCGQLAGMAGKSALTLI
jgi:23S rRNA (adenine2503-C2)-methyltransferase